LDDYKYDSGIGSGRIAWADDTAIDYKSPRSQYRSSYYNEEDLGYPYDFDSTRAQYGSSRPPTLYTGRTNKYDDYKSTRENKYGSQRSQYNDRLSKSVTFRSPTPGSYRFRDPEYDLEAHKTGPSRYQRSTVASANRSTYLGKENHDGNVRVHVDVDPELDAQVTVHVNPSPPKDDRSPSRRSVRSYRTYQPQSDAVKRPWR